MILSTDLQVPTGSAYAHELIKHEANYTQYGPPGRPFVFREYPAMMYKPSRPKMGGPCLFEGQTAENEQQREQMERLGFVYGGQGAALEAIEAREFEIGELAANRTTTDIRMSAKAQAEAEAVDITTIQHLGEIPSAHPKSGRRGELK